jgi:hypothetical protein
LLTNSAFTVTYSLMWRGRLSNDKQERHWREHQGHPHEQPKAVHVAEEAGLPVDFIMDQSERSSYRHGC